MGDKISDYPAKVVIHDEDLLDFSNWNGAAFDISQKVTVLELVTYLNANIVNLYNANGALISNRTVTAATFFTKWIEGDVIVEMADEVTDYAFVVQNSSSTEMGRFGFDQASASGIIELAKVGGIGAYFQVVNESLTMNTDAFVITSGDQIGIGTASPSAVALVEITSTTKGLRITPMTAAQAAAITAIEGLVVFTSDTDATFTSIGFWGFENAAWAKL